MNRFKNEKNFYKQFLSIFNRKDQSIDENQNPIIALLKGPDSRYEKILIKENDQCPEKNSFLQSHVRPLNTKQQKRLLKKQYHQLSKRSGQSIKKKEKCLHFTFPITYPCPMKSKNEQPSIISNSSRLSRKSNSQLSNHLNRLKSAVSILFSDDKPDDMSKYKIPKKENPPSSSLLHIPIKCSSNAYIQKYFCKLCDSILSNGICSCIIPHLFQLNNTKKNDILVQFNDILENLTSNNIIT